MGLFGKKKEKVLDWSEKYKLQEKRAAIKKKEDESSNLGFLNDMANSSASNEISWDNDAPQQENYVQEKKNKLAKRLLEMTNRMEDLSNQIYHLKQRVELLEKKLKVRFE